MEITCPVCDAVFENDENIHQDGNCPKCNAHYDFNFDCDDPHDAVLIADFDYYYLSTEEREKVVQKYKMAAILSNNFSEFLKSHDTFQLALIEAVHRYYHDRCFTGGENSRFKDDDESRLVSSLLQTMHCAIPDWRYRLKKKLERYNSWEKTNALHISSKPKEIFSIDVFAKINILPSFEHNLSK